MTETPAKGRAPLPYRLVNWLLVIDLGLLIVLFVTMRVWFSSATRDAAHTFPIKEEHGPTYYYPPAAKPYLLGGLVVFFVLLVLLVGMRWWYGDQIERRQSDKADELGA